MKREDLSKDVSYGGHGKDFVRDELTNFAVK